MSFSLKIVKSKDLINEILFKAYRSSFCIIFEHEESKLSNQSREDFRENASV